MKRFLLFMVLAFVSGVSFADCPSTYSEVDTGLIYRIVKDDDSCPAGYGEVATEKLVYPVGGVCDSAKGNCDPVGATCYVGDSVDAIATPAGSASNGDTWLIGSGCTADQCTTTNASGISRCSLSAPSSIGYTISGSPNRDNSGDKCWCKMTEPYEGKWVYVGVAMGCATNCSGMCGSAMVAADTNAEIIRRAILSQFPTIWLDPTVASETYAPSNDNSGITWAAGTGCNNSSGKDVSCTKTVAAGDAWCSVTGSDNKGEEVDTIDNNEGKSCWCKITYPYSGKWTYNVKHQTKSACKTSCAKVCAEGVQTQESFRSSVYKADL